MPKLELGNILNYSEQACAFWGETSRPAGRFAGYFVSKQRKAMAIGLLSAR
jgi:hypothetical protein